MNPTPTPTEVAQATAAPASVAAQRTREAEAKRRVQLQQIAAGRQHVAGQAPTSAAPAPVSGMLGLPPRHVQSMPQLGVAQQPQPQPQPQPVVVQPLTKEEIMQLQHQQAMVHAHQQRLLVARQRQQGMDANLAAQQLGLLQQQQQLQVEQQNMAIRQRQQQAAAHAAAANQRLRHPGRPLVDGVPAHGATVQAVSSSRAVPPDPHGLVAPGDEPRPAFEHPPVASSQALAAGAGAAHMRGHAATREGADAQAHAGGAGSRADPSTPAQDSINSVENFLARRRRQPVETFLAVSAARRAQEVRDAVAASSPQPSHSSRRDAVASSGSGGGGARRSQSTEGRRRNHAGHTSSSMAATGGTSTTGARPQRARRVNSSGTRRNRKSGSGAKGAGKKGARAAFLPRIG